MARRARRVTLAGIGFTVSLLIGELAFDYGTVAALTLKEATVKSYLQSAMAKLDASTRHGAVLKARRAGLLP